MTSNQKNWTVLLTSMLVIGVPVLALLQMNAADEESVTLVLRLTAWISFLVYVLIFITRPVRQLFASPLTRTMLNNRRYFGIVFAGSHTVHLALIIKFALDPNNLPPTLHYWRRCVRIALSDADYFLQRAGSSDWARCMAPPAQDRTLLDRWNLHLYARLQFLVRP